MNPTTQKTALVSGASIAGLATAFWLNKLGYHVTVVELALGLRTGGAAGNVQGPALAAAKRMGIFEQLLGSRLQLEQWEIKDADDRTVRLLLTHDENTPPPASDDDIEDIEIERAKLLGILFDTIKNDVEFLFNNRVTALDEVPDAVRATFQAGPPRTFGLVFGCDGLHSGVRKLWFGPEAEYAQFMQHYFSLTIVNKLLIKPNTAHMYNTPGKVIMLNAYNGKTDVAFCFFAEQEIPHHYRDAAHQRQLIAEQFAGEGWRSAELLAEVAQAGTAYFDKFCQIQMPSWTKGRVALVGDAAHAASPAAGIGTSLALAGAAAVADALALHPANVEAAFQEYNQQLRPFIEEVQAQAVVMLSNHLVPGTEEGIRTRNAQESFF